MDSQAAPSGGDSNRGTTFIIVATVSGFLATLTTLARISVRTVHRQLGWDDFCIAVATVLIWLEVVSNGLEYSAGFGRHVHYLSESQVLTSLKWNYISQVWIFPVIGITKLSICLFVLRMKKTGWLRWCLFALMGGLVITTLVCEIVLFAQCQPIHAFWDRKSGKCWEASIYNNVIWAQVAYSIFSDFACSLLPVVILWKVQMATYQKVLVCGLMSLGLLATACAAGRASLSTNDESTDLTWSLVTISIWGCLEESLCIIGANLALSRAAYALVRDGRWSTAFKRSYNYNHSATQNRPSTNGRRGQHRSLSLGSHDTFIPLEESKIQKVTQLSVVNEPRRLSTEAIESTDYGNYLRGVEDRV